MPEHMSLIGSGTLILVLLAAVSITSRNRSDRCRFILPPDPSFVLLTCDLVRVVSIAAVHGVVTD